jgi:hypothetical protein
LGAICMAVVFLWFMCISITILCLLGSMDMIADYLFSILQSLSFSETMLGVFPSCC